MPRQVAHKCLALFFLLRGLEALGPNFTSPLLEDLCPVGEDGFRLGWKKGAPVGLQHKS